VHHRRHPGQVSNLSILPSFHPWFETFQIPAPCAPSPPLLLLFFFWIERLERIEDPLCRKGFQLSNLSAEVGIKVGKTPT